MDDDTLVGALRTATAAMAATVRAAEPHAPVPACPGWSVTDLVDHLGRVHLWAAHCARHGSPPDPYPRRDREQTLPDWYAACADTLVATLAELPPDHPSWSFSAVPGHQDVRFWRRRQIHETTIHHVDALQSGGLLPTTGLVDRIPGLTTEQATDGVVEVFEVMAPRSLVRHATVRRWRWFPLRNRLPSRARTPMPRGPCAWSREWYGWSTVLRRRRSPGSMDRRPTSTLRCGTARTQRCS